MDDLGLSQDVWTALRCPECHAALRRGDSGAGCERCGARFGTSKGTLDLRPVRPRDYPLVFRVGDDALREDALAFAPLELNAHPAVDYGDMAVPQHMSRELLSHVPAADSPRAMALDVGCGHGVHRDACAGAGFQWVGVDQEAQGASLLADAHCLPFADASFDFVLSIAALEHLRYPFVAMTEAFRVLRPGGAIIGTVAFGEPFHMESHYHHTHLGTLNTLTHAGFHVSVVAPDAEWTALEAQAEMALFPGLPTRLRRLIIGPVAGLHRLWWALARRLGRAWATEELRVRSSTGVYAFIAHKPTQATE